AAWLVFALPLAPAIVAMSPNRRARIATLAAAMALAVCLVVTRSASGFLALAAAGLVTIALRAPRAIPPRLVGGLALVIPVAALFLGLATHSGRGRIMIWMETLLIWIRHPWLGVGLGQYNLYQLEAQHHFFALGDWTRDFHQNAAFVLDAHNQYLQILAEQGLLGLGLFLFLVYLIIRSAG